MTADEEIERLKDRLRRDNTSLKAEIAERERVEVALRESEELHRIALR